MKKIIGLTYDKKEDNFNSSDEMMERNAEFDSEQTIQDIIGALESAGHRVKKIGDARNLLLQINDLGVDIVFNIAEGACGRNRESQVPLILEMHGIPYIGSDALTMGLTLDKAVAKKCFIADHIPTARYFLARNRDDLVNANHLGFPLIVKPCSEGTSKGITSQSRVENMEQLKAQVDLIVDRFCQPALVEEFIPGKEFTVVVFGNQNPEPMPVVQYAINGEFDLGDLFYTFDHVKKENVAYVCPAKISLGLTKTLQELAVKVYQSVGCRDFGRVDFRVNGQGQPFVLEINPLPCLAKKDTFSFVAQAIGQPFDRMILRVLDEGLKRLETVHQEAGV
jgi:D-alanine-D-alanine ligase